MRIILIIISAFVIFFLGVFIKTVIQQIRQGKVIIKFIGKREKLGKLKRIFYKLPERLALDLFNRDPNDFAFYGLHMFCGQQGKGKTIGVVEFLQRIKLLYPECQIYTNMGYTEQNGKITHWKDVVERTNGTKGVVEVIDEIQAWFSSNQSKDFPPEMLAEISQQRKQRKMLIGTAQVFSRISKPIREQTTFVYLPITFTGCLTIVRRSRPEFWNDEKQEFTKFEKTYFFVHTDKIRNSFDTYERIGDYKEKGFKSDLIRLNIQ